MKTRLYTKNDYATAKVIHEKYYEFEFPFPDFNDLNSAGRYVVEDDDGSVILVGDLKLLVEAVLLTDKSKHPRKVHDALTAFLTVATFEAKFTQLHCTVFDPRWMKQLVKRGFDKCKGVFLFKNI